MIVEPPVLDAENSHHDMVRKLLSRGVGDLQRTHPSQRLAVSRLDENLPIAHLGNTAIERQVSKHPKHRYGHQEHYENRYDGDTFDEPSEEAPDLSRPWRRLPLAGGRETLTGAVGECRQIALNSPEKLFSCGSRSIPFAAGGQTLQRALLVRGR